MAYWSCCHRMPSCTLLTHAFAISPASFDGICPQWAVNYQQVCVHGLCSQACTIPLHTLCVDGGRDQIPTTPLDIMKVTLHLQNWPWSIAHPHLLLVGTQSTESPHQGQPAPALAHSSAACIFATQQRRR